MKKAGDLLSAFFDADTLKEAKKYGTLFSSWAALLEHCGLSQGASHSRIRALERSVLMVEADHPGWIQLLQTRQREILETVRRRFPEITLSGISFRLSRNPPAGFESPAAERAEYREKKPDPAKADSKEAPLEIKAPGQTLDIDAIEDENLRNLLKRLKQSIYQRNGVPKENTQQRFPKER
ncbi:MAG: DUF721 domain-containing protein [Spirochaetaceae bacterium]|jgi:hypothetical protein|nr:DUF721 domain-containing protein [Spirochaetaceae bacterium]